MTEYGMWEVTRQVVTLYAILVLVYVLSALRWKRRKALAEGKV